MSIVLDAQLDCSTGYQGEWHGTDSVRGKKQAVQNKLDFPVTQNLEYGQGMALWKDKGKFILGRYDFKFY